MTSLSVGGGAKHKVSQKKTHPAVKLSSLSPQLSTVKVSTTNSECPHQCWTCQLLCRSSLLPRPSTLKLISLPLVSGASLRLTLSEGGWRGAFAQDINTSARLCAKNAGELGAYLWDTAVCPF